MQALFGFLSIISFLVFLIGMINPKLFKNNKTDIVPGRAKIASFAIVIFLFSLAMVGMLGKETLENNTISTKSENVAPDVATTSLNPETLPAQVGHNYALKDGYEYGYEMALSENDKAAGKVASDILMFKYAGDKDNSFQVYQKSDDIATIIECEFPCEFLKIITYSTNLGHISTDRIRRVDGTIGSMVIADAVDGNLEKYEIERDGQKYNVWWDEHNGVSYTAVK